MIDAMETQGCQRIPDFMVIVNEVTLVGTLWQMVPEEPPVNIEHLEASLPTTLRDELVIEPVVLVIVLFAIAFRYALAYGRKFSFFR